MENSMPRSPKEGLLYGSIICALTCLFMATINICISMGGVSKESLLTVLKAFPVVFIIAMILETFIIGRIASKLVGVFITQNDCLNAHIMFRTFFTVVGMSIFMTLIGGSLGTGLNMELIKEFPHAWPRNFTIVIFLELIMVQPIARKVMRLIHENKEKNNSNFSAN